MVLYISLKNCPRDICTTLLSSHARSLGTHSGRSMGSPTFKLEVGKPVVIELTDGSSFRAFVHAYDKLSTIACLELIPNAEAALISTSNVKSVSPLPATDYPRSWPSSRSFHQTTFSVLWLDSPFFVLLSAQTANACDPLETHSVSAIRFWMLSIYRLATSPR